jgi:hypothetical protein
VQPSYDNRAILEAFVGRAVKPLVLLGPTAGPNQLTAIADWVTLAREIWELAQALGLEIAVNDGNEPNWATHWEWRPGQWADKCVAVYEALRGDGFLGPIYAGCESNFGAARYQRAMHWEDLPGDLIPDVHWYSDQGDFFGRPHWGATLEDAFWHVFEACDMRNFAVTETGLSSAGADAATFDALRHGIPLDDWIGSQMTQVFDFLAAHACPLVGYFQINDGPAADHESHYGLRYFETSHPADRPWPWKPQSYHVQCWHHRPGRTA